MTKQHFNFDEIFSFAWSKTKQHAWFIVCSFIIYAVILSAVRLMPVLDTIVLVLTVLSALSVSLIIVKNESFSFADLFNKLRSPKLVINFFILLAVYTAIVLALTVPFIVTASLSLGAYMSGAVFSSKLISLLVVTTLLMLLGIFVTVRFKFFPYVLIENEHKNALEIAKQTYKLTCCAFWQIFKLMVVLTVINLLGLIAFGFGLLVTVPVSMFALAHAFRKLEGHAH